MNMAAFCNRASWIAGQPEAVRLNANVDRLGSDWAKPISMSSTLRAVNVCETVAAQVTGIAEGSAGEIQRGIAKRGGGDWRIARERQRYIDTIRLSRFTGVE